LLQIGGMIPQGRKTAGIPIWPGRNKAFLKRYKNLEISENDAVIYLNWDPVPGTDEYIIYASEDPSLPFAEWAYLGTSSTTQFSTAAASRLFFIVRSSQ
jgi:hypothetical protein